MSYNSRPAELLYLKLYFYDNQPNVVNNVKQFTAPFLMSPFGARVPPTLPKLNWHLYCFFGMFLGTPDTPLLHTARVALIRPGGGGGSRSRELCVGSLKQHRKR